jgi:hypothetical protein
MTSNHGGKGKTTTRSWRRAREHHARTGEWPPDPLLDEVAEMRRRVLAEHGNDYQKVLEWYVELGKQRAAQNGSSANGAK